MKIPKSLLKNSVAFVIGLALLMTSSTAFASFTDVSTSHPNYDAITFLQDRGVIEGYSDGTFRPDNTVNRVEALKMILLGAEIEVPNYDWLTGFTDTPVDQWYIKYINKAKADNIVQGYPDNSFRPNNTVNLVENLKILIVAKNVNLSGLIIENLIFNDAPGTEWYGSYMQYSKDKNLVEADYNNNVYPNQGMTRGRLAEVMYRLMYMEEMGLSRYEKDDGTRVCNAPSDTTYLIVTRPMFESVLPTFASFKENQGEKVFTTTVEDIILCGTTGRDIPEKTRNYIRSVMQSTDLENILLVGNPRMYTEVMNNDYLTHDLAYDWELPIRYVIDFTKDNPAYIPTDQYYASLSNTWDTDSDNIFGEYNLSNNTYDLSFFPDVYVGRVPVRNANDLNNWINKNLNWRAPQNPVHSEFVSQACDNVDGWVDPATGLPRNRDISFIAEIHNIIFNYCQNTSGGDIVDFANQQNSDFISTYGHGNLTQTFKAFVSKSDGSFGEDPNLGYKISTDSPGFNKSPILFIHGCLVGGLDYFAENMSSLAQQQIASPTGAVAFLGASRSHADIRFKVWESVFLDKKYELGAAFYYNKYEGFTKSKHREKVNFLMYQLYGDPALKIVEPKVEVTIPEVIFFDGQNSKTITVTVKNLSGYQLTGKVKNQIGNETSDVILEPYSTQYVPMQIFSSYRPEVIIPQKFWFELQGGTKSLGGDETIYTSYVSYFCDAWEIPEGNGSSSGKWRVTVTPNQVGTQDDLYIKVYTKPKYYGGDPVPELNLEYSGSIDMSNQSNHYFDVNKTQDPPEEPDRYPWFFSLVMTEIVDVNGTLLSTCNASP